MERVKLEYDKRQADLARCLAESAPPPPPHPISWVKFPGLLAAVARDGIKADLAQFMAGFAPLPPPHTPWRERPGLFAVVIRNGIETVSRRNKDRNLDGRPPRRDGGGGDN